MADHLVRAPLIRGHVEDSYCVLSGHADRGLILICDHASNALPPGYGTLGLSPSQLERHIGYDIGVATIVRTLASQLGAPAVMTRYSRLLIDPNRGRDDPTLILRISDGTIVPGNKKLDAAEREKRLHLYYDPYHRAIDAVVGQCLATGVPPVLLSIHSFTESWKHFTRPWHVGVLWDGGDARLAAPLLEAFYAEGDLIVGDNQPYAGQLEGDCLWQHGARRGLANAIVEVRQDLIRDAAGQKAWSERLCRIVEKILPDAEAARRLAGPTGNTQRTLGDGTMTKLDKTLVTELEAAAFRRLVEHLRARTDVQNIDLMNIAGFCRNCLANWYGDAAREKGVELSKDETREIVYGMPYEEWKALHQPEASPEQLGRFESTGDHKNR